MCDALRCDFCKEVILEGQDVSEAQRGVVHDDCLAKAEDEIRTAAMQWHEQHGPPIPVGQKDHERLEEIAYEHARLVQALASVRWVSITQLSDGFYVGWRSQRWDYPRIGPYDTVEEAIRAWAFQVAPDEDDGHDSLD